MQEVRIERRYGPFGVTRVLVTRNGRDYVFFAGRHLSERRIHELAQSSANNFMKEIGIYDEQTDTQATPAQTIE